ncbi:hypothetical protein SME36J_46190 [Serratia marcescens]|nr:hypothetical protein SME36J_46190 [Serratia marcescens]
MDMRQLDLATRFDGQPLLHASLAPEEYRRLLQENGFRVVDHVVEDPACKGRTVWLAKPLNDNVTGEFTGTLPLTFAAVITLVH